MVKLVDTSDLGSDAARYGGSSPSMRTKPALGQVLLYISKSPAKGGIQNIYMANITRENIELLNDKITVTLQKDDYYPSFDKSIKDYSKKANIPGFRKGMVPVGMVKKMYGPAIFSEEVIKVVEKKLLEYIKEEKPDIFAQPLPLDSDLRNMDMNNPGDYEFNFEIGLKPPVSLEALSGASLTFHRVEITNQLIDDEVNRLQSRFGSMSEPDSISSDDNNLDLLFTESDEHGVPVGGGIVKEMALVVKYFSTSLRALLMGKKKDDFIIIQLSKAFEDQEKKWILNDLGINNEESNDEKYFVLLIKKISMLIKQELGPDLFSKVYPALDIVDEQAFREAIKSQLASNWDKQSQIQLHDQIYHTLIDMPLELPEKFLKHWMERGGEKVKSPEEVEAEYPSFSKQLKWTLLSDKIIKDNDLQVSEEELRENMKKEVMQYFGESDISGANMGWLDNYIDRMMKEEKQVEGSYQRLITHKVFEWAESKVTPITKSVTPEELNAMQHHH